MLTPQLRADEIAVFAEYAIVFVVMAELNVSADIPGESLPVAETTGKTASPVTGLDKKPVIDCALLKAVRCSKACWPGTQNEDFPEPCTFLHHLSVLRFLAGRRKRRTL